jgi:hypothetical protein
MQKLVRHSIALVRCSSFYPLPESDEATAPCSPGIKVEQNALPRPCQGMKRRQHRRNATLRELTLPFLPRPERILPGRYDLVGWLFGQSFKLNFPGPILKIRRRGCDRSPTTTSASPRHSHSTDIDYLETSRRRHPSCLEQGYSKTLSCHHSVGICDHGTTSRTPRCSQR